MAMLHTSSVSWRTEGMAAFDQISATDCIIAVSDDGAHDAKAAA
jgi:hypothetical protein